jgi:hypothetical protein
MSDLGTHTNCGGQIRETGHADLWPYFCEKCSFQFASLAHAENELEKEPRLVWALDEFSHTYYAKLVPPDEAGAYEPFKL